MKENLFEKTQVQIWKSFSKSETRTTYCQVKSQFLAAKSPFKIMKNAFYFTSKALFVLKIFKFLAWLFGHVSKRPDQKDRVNFKLYDATAWLTNNCNIHKTQYLER